MVIQMEERRKCSKCGSESIHKNTVGCRESAYTTYRCMVCGHIWA